MKEIVIGVEGMNCGHCKAAVESEVKELDGVENAEVNLEDKNVKISLSKEIEMEKFYEAIEEAGFEPVK